MQPRAIETRYKGYRFRSRLEARWAVFFDALGLKWDYEPEGFELEGGVRYLPDFLLYDVAGNGKRNAFAEVKPSLGDDAKAKMLSRARVVKNEFWIDGERFESFNQPLVLVLVGPPDEKSYEMLLDGRVLFCGAFDRPKGRAVFCRAQPAGAAGAAVRLSAAGVGAIHAARSARFEHGERG